MSRIQEIGATVVAVALVASMVTMGVALGPGVAEARHPDDAPDMTEYANFRTEFPYQTDHYPGDVNEENGSILYSASGAEAFEQQDAEEGVYIDWIIVHAEYQGEDWIDYSACDTENTEAFGIDRGDNKSGSQYDEDLVQKQKQANFLDNGITINFYDFEDFGGDPPYMAPEDAIVAAQGAGSSGGACLTLTSEPGWYRVAAFMNGTVADNGKGEEPSADAERVSLELKANYMYVCECDSEEEAREQLGKPPNERDGSGSTPTATPTPGGEETPTDTPEPTEAGTPTPTLEPATDSPEPTEDPGGGGGTPAATTEGGTGGDGGAGGDGAGNATPTPGAGPGFGAVAALLSLLAAALLAHRRS